MLVSWLACLEPIKGLYEPEMANASVTAADLLRNNSELVLACMVARWLHLQATDWLLAGALQQAANDAAASVQVHHVAS